MPSKRWAVANKGKREMTIQQAQDQAIDVLLQLARVDAETPGEWTAETANARCEDYAHYVLELFGETHACGERLNGVFVRHHCNNA
jgi:hypothetical protein